MQDVRTIVPDMTFTLEDWAVSGDRVWVRARGRGTATGPFFGPPSNRPVDIAVIDVARVVDGRNVEHWGVPDRFAMLAQTAGSSTGWHHRARSFTRIPAKGRDTPPLA